MLALGPLQEPGGGGEHFKYGPILRPGLTEGFLVRKARVACQV